MNKEEYKTIMKLLEEEKIDELKMYLDERINSKYIDGARKALLELIDNDSEKKYPSYYARKNLHHGVMKLYRGLYTATENGFVICHKMSNLFELYDKSILTPNIKEMLEATSMYNDLGKIESLPGLVSKTIKKENLRPVFCTQIDKENVRTSTGDYDESLYVPTKYYKIAHKLLGKETKEWMFEIGLYFESPKGKALVLKRK